MRECIDGGTPPCAMMHFIPTFERKGADELSCLPQGNEIMEDFLGA
jgi:hypothetical protein